MTNEIPGSNADQLTQANRAALIRRMQAAWANLPADIQAKLKPMLDASHKQLAAFIENPTNVPEHSTQQTLRTKSYLTGDWDGYLAKMGQSLTPLAAAPAPDVVQGAAQPAAVQEPGGAVADAIAAAEVVPHLDVVVKVGGDGTIFGTSKYQQLDPRWELVAGTVWLENLLHKHKYPSGAPKVLAMEDKVNIVMVGDFGTGNFGAGTSPSVKISQFVPSLNPDYTIHLGDTYYAGVSEEETGNFLNYWPKGSKGSFALNSNHDMYSGGDPYFNQVVGGPMFAKSQAPWSFFAMENANWVIVGLDSAYYSSVLELYMNGTLGANTAQVAFLKQIAALGKKVIVLTHHNPIGDSGPQSTAATPLQLYKDVTAAFPAGKAPAFWYYGHVHMGAAYAPYNGMQFRVLGHGGLPWGLAGDLMTAKANGAVTWFEDENAKDLEDPVRVLNGFVQLQLDGPTLTETFRDENGNVRWTQVHT
jgi:hypothetical protein